MTQEAYVSYEVAKLLKEKGFDEPCRAIYEEEVLRTNTLCDYYNYEYYNCESYVCASTHQTALAWLRQTHKINIVIIPVVADDDGDGGCLYKYIIFKLTEVVCKSVCLYEKYSVACNYALKYVLKNLI